MKASASSKIIRFSAECGIPRGLRLLLRTSDDTAWHGYQLAEPFALIGTAEDCNVRLSDSSIAPFHAYLQMLDSRLFVCDLTESRGVLVDDLPVAAEWVHQNSVLQVGRYELRIAAIERDLPDPTDSSVQKIDSKPQLPILSPQAELVLSMRMGRGNIQQARSNRDVSLLGRSPACKFQMGAGDVSNFHCSFVRTNESLWVVDLGSRRGTFLNGARVKRARVPSGASMHVGRYPLQVNFEADESGEVQSIEPEAPVESLPAPVSQNVRTPDGVYSEELIRDLVADVANSQQRAFEQARELLVEVLKTQHESHAMQLETMKDQNSQLLEVIRMLTASREQAQPQIALPSPPIADPAPQPQPVSEQPVERPAKPVPPTPPPARPVAPPPPPEDPEIREAWVRGQLHTISESLKKEQERGVKKLLKSLLPGKSDDALQ